MNNESNLENYFNEINNLNEIITSLSDFNKKLEESKSIGTFNNIKSFSKFNKLDKLKPLTFYKKNSKFNLIQPLIKTQADKEFDILKKSFHSKLQKIINDITPFPVYDDNGVEIDSESILNVEEGKNQAKELLYSFYKKAYSLGMRSSGAGLDITKKITRSSLPEFAIKDVSWLKTATEDEFTYLSNLINQIVDNSINNKNRRFTVDERVLMYVNTLNSQFEAGKVVGAPTYSLIHWACHKHIEHCPGCLFLAENSPWLRENIPTTPRAGETSCRYNCACTLEIEPISKTKYDLLVNNNMTRGQAILQLKYLFK